jgi:TetR/AcrR family transcriptional regulator, transcriptional repressor of aconitase
MEASRAMAKVSQAYSDAQRKIILDAAVRCFAKEGFHRTSMRDVIRESGTSAGALYLYFKSKEELIEAIADNRHHYERQWIASAMQQADFRTSIAVLISRFGKALSDPAARRERRLSVQLWAEALRDERVRRHILKGVAMPTDLLARLLKAAQARGEFPRLLDCRAAARVLIAVFQGVVLQVAWEPKVPVQRYLKVFEAMLLGLTESKQARRSRNAAH